MSVYREPRDLPPLTVRFADLADDTRARLVAGCLGQAAPLPLLAAPLPLLRRPRAYLTGAAALIALAAGVVQARFGQIEDGPTSPVVAGSVALLVTLAVGLVAVAWRAWRLRAGLPFPAGDYLFASELVVARRGQLTLLPTAALTLNVRPPHRLDVRGPAGYHRRFAAPGRPGDRRRLAGSGRPGDELVSDLQASMAMLARADQDRDLAAQLRLDPFHGERQGWSEAPAPAAVARTWLDSFPRFALALGALSVVILGVAAPIAVGAARWLDRSAITAAEARQDEQTLLLFLRLRHPDIRLPAWADEADAALLRLALRSTDSRPLVRYLELRSPFEARRDRVLEATAELARRSEPDPGGELSLELLRVGQGPRRDETDARLLRLASEPPNEHRLRAYARHGARRDEVLGRQIPRLRLDRAVRERDLGALRLMVAPRASAGHDRVALDADMKQEIDQAIDVMLGQERVLLRERTGLRTGLAQVLDRALGDALAIVPAPGDDLDVFGSLRVVLGDVVHTYVPRSLLRLQTHERVADSSHPTIVLHLEPPGPCPPPSCRRRLRLSFEQAGEPAIAPQSILFTAPSPGSETGRTLAMAAQEALTHALLDDDRPGRR